MEAIDLEADNGLDDTFWCDLLDYVDEGRVIPIVETGALRVESEGQSWVLETLLATRLAQRLRIDLAKLPPQPTLEGVASLHLATPRARKEELYVRAMQLLKELDLSPPPALRDLAAIQPLDLFVSVSFDGLLARAIDHVRHGDQPRTDVIAFAPNRTADLPAPRARLLRPTVFHLLGRLSSAPDSVVCDDDRLEFLHALQDDARRPKLLFDELRDNHLLLLGCRLPDWAARFLLRTAKNDRLSSSRYTTEYLVSRQTAQDAPLAAFLADFSPGTRIVDVEPEAFIGELFRRYRDRHPDTSPSGAVVPAVTAAAREERGEPDQGVVFISYSSRDLEAARTLARALDAAGIDVWFDKEQLGAGDAWERKILRGLESSALFIPIVSQATQREERRRDFFWSEWNAAHNRAGRMAPGEVFILPIAVDDTEPYTAVVPERFNERQWTRLPGGQPTPEFIKTVLDHYKAFHNRAQRARG